MDTQENLRQSLLLNGPSLVKSVVKSNVRSLWLFKPRKPAIAPPPPPSPVEPCKGSPSRCLEQGYGKPVPKPRKLFGSNKGPVEIKEKPSNCVKKPPVVVKLAWWEQIIGPDPKRSWPNPCTCRLAHRERRKSRALDPRLNDARYKDTAGDVFLYTEQMKQCKQPCMEPQPKPPPAFKVPNAVLCRMLCQDSERMSLGPGTVNQQTVEVCQCSIRKPPYRLPYEELRPPEKRRKPFSCREGIRVEDVLRPFSADFTVCRNPSTPRPVNSSNVAYKCPEKPVKRVQNVKSDVEQTVQRRSRIEQLKILVQQKDTFQCISTSS